MTRFLNDTTDVRKTVALLLIVAVPLLWLFWNRRHLPSAEQQIRRAISRSLEGFEQRRLGKALSVISDDYKDSDGNRRRDLVRLAAGAFQSTQAIKVYLSGLDVQVEGDMATVNLKAAVSYADASGQEVSESYSPRLLWRKEKRKWRIVSAEALTYPE